MHGDRYLGGNVGFRWELLQFVGNLALNSGRGPWGMHGDMYLGGNVGFRWGTFAILWGTLHSTVAGDPGECMGIGTLVGMLVLDGELLQFVGNLVLSIDMGPWGMHGDLGFKVRFRV